MTPTETTSSNTERPAVDFVAPDIVRTQRASLAVLAITALTFASSLGGGFIWDDLHLIAYNRHLIGLAGLRHALTHHLWDVETVLSDNAGVRYYRPAVGALFVVLRTAFGDRPEPYHAAVVALHLAAVALAARFLTRLLGPRPLPVAAGLALFALHASRSQSVSWISGVSDVLMALPAIAAFTRVLPNRETRPTVRDAMAVTALTVLALAAKETAVVLPVAYAALVLATWPSGAAVRRAGIAFVAAPMLAAGIYFVAREIWLPIGGAGGEPGAFRHAMIVLESLGRYAGIVVWPWPIASFRTALSLDASGQIRIAWGWSLAGLVVLAAMAYAAGRAKKYRVESAGIVMAMVLVTPVLNVRWTGYVELVGDRFLYLAMLGLGASLGALLARVEPRAQRAVMLGMGGFFLAHAASVAVKAFDYRDEMSFWSAENELQPGVPRVLLGLAGADQAAGRDGHALLEIREAFSSMSHFRAGPRSGPAATMLFGMYVGLKLIPDRDRQGLLGALLFLQGLEDRGSAVAEGSLLGDPVRIPKRGLEDWLRTEGGLVRGMEAGVLSRLGRPEEAMAATQDAIARCVSRCQDVYLTAALVAARSARWDDAARFVRASRALAADPSIEQPIESQIAAARARAELASRARSPEERAVREAEALLTLDLPEAARQRLEPFASAPVTIVPRIRIALLAYQFAQAHELARALPPPEGPEALRERHSLEALEIVQRQRIAGVEALVGAR